MNEFFIERLRIAIKDCGLRQKEFAANSGISAGYLTDILKGRTEPSERVVREICLGNTLSENWLKTGEGEMRPAKDVIEGDYLDPELARIVMAEIQGRQGKEPLHLTAGEAAILEMIRDLPEDDRRRVEYEIMTAWVACRQKEQ